MTRDAPDIRFDGLDCSEDKRRLGTGGLPFVRVEKAGTATAGGTSIRSIVGMVIAGVLVVWLASLIAVVAWGARDMARPADAIVVLGAAQYDGRPSPVLKPASITRYSCGRTAWPRGWWSQAAAVQETPPRKPQ